MSRGRLLIFGMYWGIFTLWFFLLQYVFNHATNGFAFLVSAIGAAPVALMLTSKTGRGKAR